MIDNLPETLDEAVDMLVADMTEEEKHWLRTEPDVLAQIHHGPGTALRNGWGMWDKEAPLSRWFRERGIWHPDDGSAMVFGALIARLRGKFFDVIAEAAYYTEFWRESGLGFDGVPIPDHVPAKSYALVEGKDGKWRRQRRD